jgi:hypothetical protein
MRCNYSAERALQKIALSEFPSARLTVHLRLLLLQAVGCTVDVSSIGRRYHAKKKLCDVHMKVCVAGVVHCLAQLLLVCQAILPKEVQAPTLLTHCYTLPSSRAFHCHICCRCYHLSMLPLLPFHPWCSAGISHSLQGQG